MTSANRFLTGAILAMVVLVGFPWILSAQVDTTRADTAVFRIEGIRVQASRALTTPGGASAIEVTVDSLVLPSAATTEELFREIPTLHVRTNSRGEAEITVRGSESRQVAVLVDGVPLTLGWDARTDVSVLPAGAVSEVTLVRGLSSILHGPNVLGGVVEMNVARGRAVPASSSLSATVGLDDKGGYGTSATGEVPFSTSGGRGTVRFGAGYRDTPGFPLPHGVREPVHVDDNLRLNTDANNLNGFFAFRHVLDGGMWSSFSASSFKAERGIAAELGVEDPRLWRYPDVRRTILAFSGGSGDRATPWGRGDLEASVGVDLGHTEIRSYSTRDYREVTGTEDGNDGTFTFRLLGDHTITGRSDLRGSFTFSDINHEAIVDGESSKYEQRLMSLAGETGLRIVENPEGVVESLRMSVGGAWDRGSTPRTGGLESLGTLDDWGARLGFSALVNDGGTALHAGISRRGRFPALRETYSEALNRFVPNPDLHPEHLLAFEGGVTTRLGTGELQLVGFHHRLTDAIRRITLPDRKRMRVNSDELRSTGLEVLFSQSFGPLALEGDLTLQKVDLIDPETTRSSEPENMPERSGRARLSIPLIAGVSAGAEAAYTGPQFCQHPDTGEDVELKGGTWLNGVLSRVFSFRSRSGVVQRMEAMVSAENLGNTALYDQCGLPRAGRLFRLQLRVF
jgi:iron complex outermembrane receptor protein